MDNKILVVMQQSYPGQSDQDPEDFRKIFIDLGEIDENSEVWTPEPKAFEDYIRSTPARVLIRRIASGYSMEWSGHQPGNGWLQAVLNHDAKGALEELTKAINELPQDTREFWTIEEWDHHGVVRDFNADQVDELIEDPIADNNFNVVIIDNEDEIAEYALSEVAHTLDDQLYMELAESDTLMVRGFTVTVKRNNEGAIEKIVRIRTPQGHEYEM
jgi:hypothetical protein